MMSSSSAVVCREIFDENSQPSAEEVNDYAQQLGIDPESESHLLPLARDGLMQALPSPWKAYYDEKLQTHYYYNDDLKKTQWEHPLDHVYRELVKKARDTSTQDDTCASVQELLTSEENTKNLDRIETKAESDDEFSTDSGDHVSEVKDNTSTNQVSGPKRLTPSGRPPLAPLGRIDKKLGNLRISPLRRSIDSSLSPKLSLTRNMPDPLNLSSYERPKMLFKQHSEIIDLKMHVLNSPEEENFSLLSGAKSDKGLTLTGKGSMFLRVSKSDLPSPDTEKSLTLDSVTKSDPPKGILREKLSETVQRKSESVIFGKPKQTIGSEEDKKSVRFKLENLPEPTVSPSSNSSSEQNEGQSSIVSASVQTIPSPIIPLTPLILSTPLVPLSPLIPCSSMVTPQPVPSIKSTPYVNPPLVLSPLMTGLPLPPRPQTSLECLKNQKNNSGSEIESIESENRESKGTSKRRLLRPPAADYIKPDLFQKNFQKISDLVRPGDTETAPSNLDEFTTFDKETRPRSPMIPQKNKISINLMESIESEASLDSPDAEFANLDLNDLDDTCDKKKDIEDIEKITTKDNIPDHKDSNEFEEEISTQSKSSISLKNSFKGETPKSQIKASKFDNLKKSKSLHSDSDDLKEDFSKTNSVTNSIEKSPRFKISPTPSLGADFRSPRLDVGTKPWSSPLSTFKPSNNAVLAPLKSSDSATSLGKTSPRLDGVILSQGKSSSDNVVVVYQFETQENSFSRSPLVRSPVIPDVAARDMIEKNKIDERKRLELSLKKELENIRIEWIEKEKKMKNELQEQLKEGEEKFMKEMKVRLAEQADRHRREMDEALSNRELTHQRVLEDISKEFDEHLRRDTEALERQHAAKITKIKEDYQKELDEQQRKLDTENHRIISELREQLQASVNSEKNRIVEENRASLDSLKEEHAARTTELRQDYRAEVERLRTQHACHLEELRVRLAGERAGRAAATLVDRALQDKYRCLKEKYARLKHDVKMSIERRNKRREISMTTGSETEKSNSHKATQSLERCKEVNETSVSVVIETEPVRARNNNPVIKYNDNETSYSESNARKSYDNNNDEWKLKRDHSVRSAETSQSLSKMRPQRRTAVAFRELPRRRSHRDKDNAATTDYQDSSDATTADEKPKEPINGHGRRRCFTRLKSASTSRLNYSPKRGEGWSSPLEALRQQLRKLDDLEDQFPDLACQPAYSLRYPFTELGAVTKADTPELEFVRHRALIEREGMRRARAVLKRRRAALKETRASLSPHRAPSEEREATELEVALHRARALLGEKEIRLRHIERALRRLADSQPPPFIQEATTSDASSGSEVVAAAKAEAEAEAGGAVLRSLRALHADVRDIWRALDARRPYTASPETSSCNAPSASQPRLTVSAQEHSLKDTSDGGVAERARGLRAWLQTA